MCTYNGIAVNEKFSIDHKIIKGKDIGLTGLILLSLLAPNYLIYEGPYLHKIYVWGAVTLLVIGYAWKYIARDLIETWLRVTWWFVKVIFPLLIGGVSLLGIKGAILPADQ